ncbi:hypothetical protein ACUOFC_47960, partial [Escherichia sp. TWPC-MK]
MTTSDTRVRRVTFSEDQARAFNKLVLNYALPAALFV